MIDQADKLRQAIDRLKHRQAPIQQPQDLRRKTAKVITVTSGKGGVGKTNVTVNLAIALSEMGYRVIIMDADFGLANIDVLFGIMTKYSLVDVIEGNKNILQVLCDGPRNIRFISGGSGVEGLIKLEDKHLDNFVQNISLLDRIADIVLIDTGAGLSESVMRFVMAADEVLLVTTPEPTSITDAYALIKMVSNRDKNKNIRLIVNRAENSREGNMMLNRLKEVSEKFLSIIIEPLGYVMFDDFVIKSVKQQQPFMLSYPKCQAARQLREISSKIAIDGYKENKQTHEGISGFMKRLAGTIGK